LSALGATAMVIMPRHGLNRGPLVETMSTTRERSPLVQTMINQCTVFNSKRDQG